ncbi:hypothetical protein M2272_001766 [Mycobacterium frederiksbergense]|jgi:hypothetical protein|uniref:DUF732 domain-containing protein n=1 Tax=Mycolicibacterium frederiksbergense TaxID=117567 RepID=A0ABT6KYP9_9MYCO|nr:DUF732 domain-containing protein [Mycolicibacterium frederiksbergense]MDH6195137.1 hypothetical protein [Mycolicibacterium frederiksbergense]
MNAAKALGRFFAATVVSVAVGVLAGAGVASAGVNDYIKDLNNSGIDGSKEALVSLGYKACTEQGVNVTRNDSIAHIVASSSLTQSQADFLYTSALKNLCAS